MARKSRKNVQATPAVVVGPVQYKVALYARISVENEQKREADTIGNQIALLKDFVSQHQDLVVFDLYCDDDISGVSFVRPEFARMMNDIRAGKVTCVIVKDLSRLGRNMIESGEYIEQIFPRMGVRFISVTDRFDSLRDDADISIQLKNFANEAYARDISKKIRAVKRTQQLAGKWTTGTPPYGYMLDPDDKYHLFPDPQTGPIVLAIFRMVAENHTLHFIAKTLNEQGVPSPGRYLYDIGLRKTEKFKNAIWYGDFADGLLSHQDYTDLSEDYSRRADDLRIFIAELEKEKEKYSVGFGSKMQWALLIEKYKDQESLDAEMAAAFIETLTLFNDGHVEVAFRHRDEIEQVLYVAATRGKEAERYAG